MYKIVTITFESNDQIGKKAILKIVNDVKLTITFEPEIHKDDIPDYGCYLNEFVNLLTK